MTFSSGAFNGSDYGDSRSKSVSLIFSLFPFLLSLSLSFFPENGNVYFHSGEGGRGRTRNVPDLNEKNNNKKEMMSLTKFVRNVYNTCNISKYTSFFFQSESYIQRFTAAEWTSNVSESNRLVTWRDYVCCAVGGLGERITC